MSEKVGFDFKDCGYPIQKLLQNGQKLSSYINELSSLSVNRDWKHPACSILLPSEKKFLSQSLELAKKIKKPSLIIVVGIGGSNLGSMAVSQAVLTSLHNCTSKKPQLLYADTVDVRTLGGILAISKSHLKEGGNILINIVSKSGKTLETIVNFDIIYSKLKKISPEKITVVATGDENSEFEKVAASQGFHTLSIPRNVGGRYSVFSNAGLFPLQVAGINTSKLLDGAKYSLKLALSSDLRKNPAALTASFLHMQKKKGRNIHVSFMFSNNLQSMGSWYRQLMGESLGKEKNMSGTKIVKEGITPLLAIGTTDLHSMAQLFLGGPNDKTYRFVSIKDFGESLPSVNLPLSNEIIPGARGKKVSQIMDAICSGTKEAYRKKGLPFVSTALPNFDEHSLGQLMQMQMIEMMYLAKLLGVNPFDQPAVENYKLEAKRFLQLL